MHDGCGEKKRFDAALFVELYDGREGTNEHLSNF